MFRFTPYDLRRWPTVHEHILWNHLKARQMLGLKFRRQHPIGPFIVDFVCLREKIVIEVDGSIHEERVLYDKKRDLWLESKGFRILRIKNDELTQNRLGTVMKLRQDLLGIIGF